MCQGEKILTIKAKFFQEAMFLSSFSLTRSKYTAVQKGPSSPLQARIIHLRHKTSLLGTPWPFWTCIFSLGK